jgi:hypothetical protein
MTEQNVDLSKLFSAVTKALKTEQVSLNEADSYNHDHGDNMVKNFRVITQAVKQKKDATPSEQLAYASQVLAKKSSSGSANLYSQGLAQAATQLVGQSSVNSSNAMGMIQALIGGGQTASAQTQPAQSGSGDMLGSLLGGLMGGGQTASAQTQPAESGSGDMLGSLLGGLMGGGGGGQSASSSQGGGLDLGSLLSVGASLLGGGQGGGLGSLVSTLVGGSAMGSSASHSQSGNVVVNTLLSVLMKSLGGK